MKKSWIVSLLIAFACGAALSAYLQNRPVPSTLHSTQLLEGANHSAVNIFDPQDPRIRILYFGFTRCPDVCPTSLAMLSAAMKQLTPSELSHIRPIFITLDPERDKGEDTQAYAHYFHPNLEGYSGSLDTITSLAQQYGVIFQKTELKESALKYTIDHSSYFYFVHPNGAIIKKVPHTMNPQPLIFAIQQIEKGNF